jgi:antitoxin HicB
MQYPVKLEPDTNGTLVVTFPDVPEAITFGSDEAEALAHAVDALETAFMGYIEDRRPIPRPSPIRRKKWSVRLPALSKAKIELYEAMRAGKVRKTELARRLGVHMPQVDRLLDLRHASRLDLIEAALRSVGKRLLVEVEDAP